MTNIRIDTVLKVSDEDLKNLNGKIEDVLEEFSKIQSEKENASDINWSWWDHMNTY